MPHYEEFGDRSRFFFFTRQPLGFIPITKTAFYTFEKQIKGSFKCFILARKYPNACFILLWLGMMHVPCFQSLKEPYFFLCGSLQMHISGHTKRAGPV